MADRIQLRRDTAANWTNYNPILLEGEPGIELDTDQWKMGDGVHNWSDLPYRGGECVQQRGQSTTVAMSQKAVTDELNLISTAVDETLEGESGTIYWSNGNPTSYNIYNRFFIKNDGYNTVNVTAFAASDFSILVFYSSETPSSESVISKFRGGGASTAKTYNEAVPSNCKLIGISTTVASIENNTFKLSIDGNIKTAMNAIKRMVAEIITQSIDETVEDKAPSSNAVFNAVISLKKYSEYSAIQGWPDGSNKYVLNYGTHKVVTVNPGDKLEVLGSYYSSGDNGTNLFLLKTYVKPPVNNYTPDFSDSYPTRIDCKYNVLTTIIIPNDTHFAVFANVRTKDSVDFSPQSIRINGFDIVKGLQNQIGDISNLVNSNDYTQKSYNINVVPGWPDGSKVFVMNYGTHFCLPVKPGDVVFNTDSSYYLLRSYKQPSNIDNVPDFVPGYNEQYGFNANNYVVIPKGCNYIVIGVVGGNITYHYDNLSINGVRIKERIIDNISETFKALIPYSEREEIQGWVDSSNVFVMNYGTHKVLNVNPGDKLRVITGQSYSVGMFFLKTYTKPTTASGGNVPNFSAYQQGIVGVPSHSERTFTIPADTYFIAIEYKIKRSGINVTPEYLFINGIDYINGLIPQIGQLGEGAYWKDKKIVNSIIQSRMRWNDVSRESGNSAAAYRKHPPILTFAHFSDLHLADYQLKRIMTICGDLSDYIDNILFTGDGVDNFSDNFDFWNANNAQNVMYVVGNHEVRDPGTPIIFHTQTEVYAKFFSNISNWGVTYESGKLYYYKDYPLAGTQEYEIKGIRLIVLYPRLDNIAQNDYDVQMQWFVDTLASAKTAGYAVVVAQHFQFEASEVVTEVDCNFSAKNDPHWYGDSLSEDFVDAVQDFIEDGGEFITWLGGHMHRDEIIKHTATNQLCICVANASLENLYSDLTRDYRTNSNDLMNIISFDIYAKLIKIVRIGANIDYLMRTRNTICINYQTKQIISQS